MCRLRYFYLRYSHLRHPNHYSTLTKAMICQEMRAVVDDEASLAHLIKELLAIICCTVSVYTDSLKASAELEKLPNKYDMVISDQTMSGMSGLELAEKMVDNSKNIPFIICTGYSNKIDPEKGCPTNIKKVLMKPVNPEELRKHVNQLLLENMN